MSCNSHNLPNSPAWTLHRILGLLRQETGGDKQLPLWWVVHHPFFHRLFGLLRPCYYQCLFRRRSRAAKGRIHHRRGPVNILIECEMAKVLLSTITRNLFNLGTDLARKAFAVSAVRASVFSGSAYIYRVYLTTLQC